MRQKSTSDENVDRVEKLVLEDARIRVKKLAEITDLSVGVTVTRSLWSSVVMILQV